ncbi:hypothetical protein G2W53_003119 [Senna tora]|uniref:RNase H type-1 domain-containing protein n=1 Tax=Senna tora TaxID=362788 RepID=A0A835CFG6_9FABA|nr:hypothetical protein G2W53_003119 [Senna tora]
MGRSFLIALGIPKVCVTVMCVAGVIADVLIPKIIHVTKEITNVNHLPNILKHPRNNSNSVQKWIAPNHDWIKVNVDGSCYDDQGNISCGGLCRDSKGLFLNGFMRRLGRGNPFAAETWAVYHGIDHAWKSGYRKIILETDAKKVLEEINKRSHDGHPLKHVLQAIQNYCHYDWHISFSHAPRESNNAAHALAALAKNIPFGLHTFDRIPVQCIGIFAKDVEHLMSTGS